MKIDGWGRAYDSFSIKEFASIFWIYGSFIYVKSDTADVGASVFSNINTKWKLYKASNFF